MLTPKVHANILLCIMCHYMYCTFEINSYLLTFRSIRNSIFKILLKWPLSAILDVRKSLLITFLAISDRYGTLFFRRPFWMSANHFRSHFWPFQIDTELFCFGGHFGCPQITFYRISGHFRSIGHFGCLKLTFD